MNRREPHRFPITEYNPLAAARTQLRQPPCYNACVLRAFAPVLCWLAAAAPALPERVDYNDDVRPILSDRCYACHGPDAGQRQAGLRLDRPPPAAAPLAGGRRAVVPGRPAESALVQRVASSDPALRMPPAYMGHDPLGQREIDVLRRWIEQGAEWEGHWAFSPPSSAPPPRVRRAERVTGAIDSLVLARLETEGLRLAPTAPRRELARRAALDLTGLPASPEASEAFVSDASSAAYERFLDRLLASPRYGEHLAGLWLDAARYADTNGYQTDGTRSMWRWRDWVIDAFNSNLGFDRFTIEQLAGDMLPGSTREQVLATGFNRNHRTTAEGGSVNEEFRVEYVADRAETTATVWLGLTLACARCHDHKFDPLSQADYYRFFAYFNNVEEKGMVWNFGNEDPLIRAPLPEQEHQLGRLERELEAAERRWSALAGRVRRERAAWEAALGAAAGTDWAPARGLAARVPFDGRMQVASKTGGSIDGSSQTEPAGTRYGPGRVGSAGEFDGTRYADLGKVGVFNYTDPLSVSAWIYPDSDADSSIVASMGENPIGSGWGLFVRDGRLWWHMSQRWTDLSVRLRTKRAIEPGRWQHVLVAYDGKRKAKGIRLYIDGAEQETEVLFDNLDWPSRSDATLKVGGGGGVDHRFRGRIDEVRVYSRDLSPAEARSLAVPETLAELAALPAAARTAAQRDKLRAAFLAAGASPAVRDALREAREARRRLQAFADSLPTAMVMKEGPKRQAYVLERGRYDAHGEPVEAGLPAAVAGPGAAGASDRLQLARWIASPSNPLTARVTVNRFWQMLFGVGLVKTVDDFGSQGEAPSNQALLDWLAVEFVESGWDVKQLLKTIMLSATYRQSSKVDPALLERDPENRLLARGPRFRLPAAAIRDQALAASGLLHERLGGPSVRPYQPPGLWEELSGTAYDTGRGRDLYRRSLYTYWKRTVAPPSMVNFDASDREVCTVNVKRTNTPLQALNLMNDTTFVEAARHLAGRVLRDGPRSASERIRAVYLRVLGRPPSRDEVGVLARLLDSYRTEYEASLDAAESLLAVGASPRDAAANPRELAAYAGIASLVLNLDEAVTKQ